ncbi:MAG: cell division protein SepF [Cyanophyceae cyanobacterium]
MKTILTKLKDFVGLNEAEDYDDIELVYPSSEEPIYDEKDAPVEERPAYRRNRESTLTAETDMGTTSTRSNVIGMPGVSTGVSEVVVIEPNSFEDMPQVIQTLRERRSVVLNLNVMDPDEAQRAVDFVAGGTYAIDGHQERIGESIFLFTPSCVKVSTLQGVVHEAEEAMQAAVPSAIPWSPDTERIAQ